jgi:hypothetical protein
MSSNRARRRNVRFRDDVKSDADPRSVKSSKQAAQKRISDASFKPLMLFIALFAISVYTVYKTAGVQRFIYGSRVLEKMKWWEGSIVYQVYPRSFQDSDGDGVGDIAGEIIMQSAYECFEMFLNFMAWYLCIGITSRLDHFKELSVEAIWLSPIYESPMIDFGYDISNFTAIDSIFGTMEDFEELVEQAHARGRSTQRILHAHGNILSRKLLSKSYKIIAHDH